MHETSYVRASTVEEACSLLKKGYPTKTVVMAGGTDLLILRKQRLIDPERFLYLKAIPNLRRINAGEQGLSVGSMVTLDEVARNQDIKENYRILAQAASLVASPQVRHKATIGGNLCLNSRCWFYNRSPFWRIEYSECRKASGGARCYVLPKSRKGCFALLSGDMVGPLVAMNAKLKLASERNQREISIEDFYPGDGINYLALSPGEILTEVVLPRPCRKGAFYKFRPQNNLDFATFTLSVVHPLDGTGSRIVIGSVANKPLRATEAERMLDEGKNIVDIANSAVKELPLVSFVRGDVKFKRETIRAKLIDILR